MIEVDLLSWVCRNGWTSQKKINKHEKSQMSDDRFRRMKSI